MKKLLAFAGIFLFSFLTLSSMPKSDGSDPIDYEEFEFPEITLDLSCPFDEPIIKQFELSTPYEIKRLACSPDGEFFITNRQLFLKYGNSWNNRTLQKSYGKISLSESGLLATLVISEEAKHICISNPSQKEEELIRFTITDNVTDLAWHPTDNILATISATGMVVLWRPFYTAVDKRIIAWYKVDTTKAGPRLSWSPDGEKLAVISGNNVVFLKLRNKPKTNKKKLFSEHDYFHLSKIIAFSWIANEGFTSVSDDQISIIIDFKNNKKTKTNKESVIKHLAYSSDGKYTASVDRNNSLQIHAKNELAYEYKEYSTISHIEWLPKTNTLLVVTKSNSFTELGDSILFIDMPADENG